MAAEGGAEGDDDGVAEGVPELARAHEEPLVPLQGEARPAPALRRVEGVDEEHDEGREEEGDHRAVDEVGEGEALAALRVALPPASRQRRRCGAGGAGCP